MALGQAASIWYLSVMVQKAAPGWYPIPGEPRVEGWWGGSAWSGERRRRREPVRWNALQEDDLVEVGAYSSTGEPLGSRTDLLAPAIPTHPHSEPQFRSPAATVPGRVSGFVCSLVAILFTTVPIVAAPLSILGIVQSSRALRGQPPAHRWRGLPVAGLITGIVALSITVVLMIMAIPGAAQANFGRG